MASTPPEGSHAVESLYEDYRNLSTLTQKNGPSELSAVSSIYAKSLLIAAASNLEEQVKGLLLTAFQSHGRPELREFIRKAVVARGYHALFDWEAKNSNKFFGLFGDEAKERLRTTRISDSTFELAESSFLELGRARNQLVHGDFASFYLELTPEEIIQKYRETEAFIQRIEDLALPLVGSSRAR